MERMLFSSRDFVVETLWKGKILSPISGSRDQLAAKGLIVPFEGINDLLQHQDYTLRSQDRPQHQSPHILPF